MDKRDACLNNSYVYAIGGSGNNYHMDNKKGYSFKVGGIFNFKVDFDEGKYTMKYKEKEDDNNWKEIGNKNIKGFKLLPLCSVYYKNDTQVTLSFPW